MGARLNGVLLSALFLLVVSYLNPTYGQGMAGIGQGPASDQGNANPSGTDAGNLDKLLDMADKDVSQLSNVNVSGHTGSASLDQPVSTVERQESTVGKTPAAVFVITNEMIRRSGATTLPDLFRMVPGMDVANINSNTWAVSSRGFNGLYAGKMLVQIDGRTVYNPLYAGVEWDAQNVLLEDVDRIEVVRGPGATIWGSNAVNGIINILTKRAKDTQGGFFQAGGGTHEKDFTSTRAGGRIGENLYYRVYGKWFEYGPGDLPDGIGADDWRQARGGFRMDYDADKADKMTFQGDCYNGYNDGTSITPASTPPFLQIVNFNNRAAGNNLLYRWTHTTDEERDWTFQAYYDRVLEDIFPQIMSMNYDLADFDFQNRFPLNERNKIIWGFEYRYWQMSVQSDPFVISFTPPDRYDKVFSYFLQDQITLVEDRLFVIGGSKFEYNDYTNFEYQPTVRLLWTPSERHSIWAAVSRAVQTPTYSIESIQNRMLPTQLPPSPAPPLLYPVFPVIFGTQGLKSVELLAWELGIRVQSTERFSWDLALFFNQYDQLFGTTVGMPYPSPPGYILPMNLCNGVWGETYGAELALNYKVNEQWRLQCAYTYLRMFLHEDPGVIDVIKEGDNPVNQLYVQSSWDLGHNWECDLIGRYVDALLASPEPIPNYIVMDARLAWHARKNLEFSVVGRNLLMGPHYEAPVESVTGLVTRTEVTREVYGQVTWRF
jgi:iron complex outermembrane receptor protein